MIYSFSRLKKYADCPAAFQYQYLYELPDPPTEPLILGKTVHAAIQAYLSGTDMNTAIDNAMRQDAKFPIDRNEVAKLAQHPSVTGGLGGQVEQHFTVPLDKAGTIFLQGYIDWWKQEPEGTIHLIDWKTNRVPYQPMSTQQLGLYAWYLSQVTGADAIDAELVFLRYGADCCRQTHRYTQDDQQQARRWALTLAEEIEEKVAEWNLSGDEDGDGLFPATPGNHCQYCGYASLCIQSAKIEPIQIADCADAKKLATEAVRLDAALSDMKNKLKAWVKENGDIAIGDAAFSFVPSESWAIASDKLYELCAELHDAGIDVFQYLTLTAANVKKLGLSEAQLAVYGRKKINRAFRLVKAKEAC